MNQLFRPIRVTDLFLEKRHLRLFQLSRNEGDEFEHVESRDVACQHRAHPPNVRGPIVHSVKNIVLTQPDGPVNATVSCRCDLRQRPART